MKKILTLILISASISYSNAAIVTTHPSDTLQEVKYILSSRNAEAQTGKYKKLDLALAFDAKTRTYTLDIETQREINAYIEITDQDENVIFFKQTILTSGDNRLTFIGEAAKKDFSEDSDSNPLFLHCDTTCHS